MVCVTVPQCELLDGCISDVCGYGNNVVQGGHDQIDWIIDNFKTRMHADLQLFGGGGFAFSPKLLCMDIGGRGERNLKVEHELWPKREVRLGM
jgi:hypothetical protein